MRNYLLFSGVDKALNEGKSSGEATSFNPEIKRLRNLKTSSASHKLSEFLLLFNRKCFEFNLVITPPRVNKAKPKVEEISEVETDFVKEKERPTTKSMTIRKRV